MLRRMGCELSLASRRLDFVGGRTHGLRFGLGSCPASRLNCDSARTFPIAKVKVPRGLKPGFLFFPIGTAGGRALPKIIGSRFYGRAALRHQAHDFVLAPLAMVCRRCV